MLTTIALSLLLITGSCDDECEQLAKRVESLTAQVKQLEAENASLRSQIALASLAQLDANAILGKVVERYSGFDSYVDEGEITVETDGRKHPQEFRLDSARAHGFRFEFAKGSPAHYLLQFDSEGLSLLANDVALLLDWKSSPDLLESAFAGYQALVNKSTPFVPVLLRMQNPLESDFFNFENLERLDDAMIDATSCVRIRGMLRNPWPDEERTSTLWIDASNWTVKRVAEEFTSKFEKGVVTMDANPKVNPPTETLNFDFDPPPSVPVIDERSR